MSGIYFDDGIVLKTYSAMTKAGKSVIKIELETRDHYDLASLLRQLDGVEREQLAREKAAKQPARKQKKDLLALPAPPLRLPYFPEDD